MNYIINRIEKNVPNHKHKDYEIIIYTNESGITTVNGKSYNVSPGKIVIVPPGYVHSSSNATENFERIYIMGDFSQFILPDCPTLILDNSEKEGLYLANMIYNNRYNNQEYITALINAFLHFLLQNIKLDDKIYLTVKNISEFIISNFHDYDINLHTLLESSGYAEDYIRSQFKKITNQTPIEFLTKIRINHARYLIDIYKNTYSMTEIAEKCGFDDYAYFSRRFKQITGVSPKKYMSGN